MKNFEVVWVLIKIEEWGEKNSLFVHTAAFFERVGKEIEVRKNFSVRERNFLSTFGILKQLSLILLLV